ncbi:MAG: ABC transporter permease [Deltaproteobacteria bacterium]|nr:MAG: ABC transporter permease [Deltaproteobacteria bacterium]
MKGFILIGVVAMNAIQVCQLDMAYVLLYDIWSKSLKHSFVAPIGIRHILIGSMIIGIIRGGAVFFILAFLSQIVFHFNIVALNLTATSFFLSGLFLNAAIIGMLVSILVLLVGYKAEVAAWSVVSIMFLICGIYYPISILPDWAQLIAKALPLTYFLEYYRSFYGFKPFCSSVLLKGYLLLFIYLVLEIYLMQAALIRAKKNGMLLKLSE